MEESVAGQELRERLIVAGISEIEAHGLADFSLRRVASACGASCAAPYKHFKNKDALFLEILRFINRQWGLLEEQITALYAENPRRELTELCMANVRFRVANPHFRAVLMSGGQSLSAAHRLEIGRSTERISALAAAVFGEDAAQKQYMLQALIYGTALLIGNGDYENTPEMLQTVRSAIENITLVT